MAYFEEGSNALVTLEAMVDTAGLRNVLWALSAICRAKATHIEVNWQDKPLAQAWEAAALVTDKAAAQKVIGLFSRRKED
jgi:hypothetical protein